jgi:spore coat protein H
MKKISLLIFMIGLSLILFSCDYVIIPIETDPTNPFDIVNTPEDTPIIDPSLPIDTEIPIVDPTLPIETEIPIVDPTLPISTPVEPFNRLFNDEIKKTLTIQITQTEWDNLNQKMIDYNQQFGNYRTDAYAKANLLFEDQDGTVFINDIGFRSRGNLSRVLLENQNGSLNMSHFKLSFHEDFDLEEYKVNNNRTVFEVEEIEMKFNRNGDSTYITEKYALDLFRELDVYAAHTTLANIYVQIDNEVHYYGVYTLFEPIDKLFLERRMTKDEAKGNLYKSLWQQFGPAALQTGYDANAIGIKNESINYRPSYDLKTNKKSPNHSQLVDFINQINQLNGPAFKTYIENHFNVDMFLRYLAVGVMLGNPDDYRAMGNNYYLYHNPVSNQWMMIPYDYDHGLGQGWQGEQVFSNYTIGANIYRWGNLNKALLGVDSYPHPLVDKILMIPEFQLLYENYLRQLISEDSLFTFSRFYEIYDTQKRHYNSSVSDAMYKLGFNRRNTEWYFNNKRLDVEAQLEYYQLNPHLRGT